MADSDSPRARTPVASTLHPAYFAMVMATAIVSLAAQLRGLTGIAHALLWLNIVVYPALWSLTIWRIIRYRQQFISDLYDHGRSVGFFTMVAATCVLGNQFVIVEPRLDIAIALWLLGIVLWALITYGILAVLTVKPTKPTLAEGIHGGWLVMVVAAQSVAALGGHVAPHVGAWQDLAIFVSLVFWLGGGMLYIWIIALIFYRYTFFPLDPRQLAPPYWINMGAMAISTLSGTVLALDESASPLLTRLEPFLIGLTLWFWATATWWIPLLFILGFWRHVIRRISFSYDAVYWSAVFPLGMYTVCTHRLATLIDQPYLDVLPAWFVYIALAAWAATFLGFLHQVFRWTLGK
jgi:tellurite resistance protein TehA-like permease